MQPIYIHIANISSVLKVIYTIYISACLKVYEWCRRLTVHVAKEEHPQRMRVVDRHSSCVHHILILTARK